jgi:uncharacterized membrane protein YdfJ with MMPL/SSD domain
VLGLATALGLIGLLGHLFDIPTVGPTLATMIGLGVGIDYALFLVTKHRDQLARGMERHESIARAVATSGSAIVFAGGTVIIALLSLWVAGIPLVASLGYASAVAVFTAVLAAITLLPAILSLAGRHLFEAKLPAFLRPRARPGAAALWGRWATTVTAHPLACGLVALALLIPLIVPMFSLHLGQEDIAATPRETTERQAFDLMAAKYGPGYNGDPTIKQFGVGLSVAVLLASAMVLSLAPAMLTLFGRAVWWLPGWLAGLLPHVDIEGESEPPTQEPVSQPGLG